MYIFLKQHFHTYGTEIYTDVKSPWDQMDVMNESDCTDVSSATGCVRLCFCSTDCESEKTSMKERLNQSTAHAALWKKKASQAVLISDSGMEFL